MSKLAITTEKLFLPICYYIFRGHLVLIPVGNNYAKFCINFC